MPLEETDTIEGTPHDRKAILLRGLWMLVLALLFAVAETVLLIAAVLQFAWMLFAKEKNTFLVEFGGSLGKWLDKTARFQTGASAEKPFPWTNWEN
jgi:hypothetical protein